MVKTATLFHHVDGFRSTGAYPDHTDTYNPELEDQLIAGILDPLECEPRKEVMDSLLQRISREFIA